MVIAILYIKEWDMNWHANGTPAHARLELEPLGYLAGPSLTSYITDTFHVFFFPFHYGLLTHMWSFDICFFSPVKISPSHWQRWPAHIWLLHEFRYWPTSLRKINLIFFIHWLVHYIWNKCDCKAGLFHGQESSSCCGLKWQCLCDCGLVLVSMTGLDHPFAPGACYWQSDCLNS